MPHSAPIRPIAISIDPIAALAAWPRDRGVAALVSSGPTGPRARWSILTEPEAWRCIDDREGARAALAEVDRCPPRPSTTDPDLPPFCAGWLAMLAFELGSAFEPTMGSSPPVGPDGAWPVLALGRCAGALVHDRCTDQWFACGDVEVPAFGAPGPNAPADFTLGPRTSCTTAERYRHAVERALALIAAGDAFQVNVTQRLVAEFTGDPRALATTALRTAGVPYGAYLEFGGRALVSLSPELFLELAPDGRVVTRPIKGTRPEAADPATLAHSEKDAAELNMIVDLMRNDLGRVCAYDTVHVTQPRTIESHPSVHHGVAEVTGRLRPGASRTDLLAASFPPGSVTGAPKIRAVQIINELEAVRRGPYCGSIGFFDDGGAMTLNVAIRTLMLHGRCAAYGTGGGIVADSVPEAEERECEVKAEILRRIADQATSRVRSCIATM